METLSDARRRVGIVASAAVAGLLALTACSQGAKPLSDPSVAPTSDTPAASQDPVAVPVELSPVLTGVWEDSPTDGTASPAQDLAGGTVRYNPETGEFQTSLDFASDPVDGLEAYVLVVLGPTMRDDSCTDGFVLAASIASDNVTEWNLFDGDDLVNTGTGSRSRDGLTLSFDVADSDLKDHDFTCAQATLVDEASLTGGPINVYDQTDAVALERTEEIDQPAPGASGPAPAALGSPQEPIGDSLAGRYFWAFKSEIGSGWNTTAVLFIDDSTAHLGFPEGGLAPDCTRTGSGEFFSSDFAPGCIQYSYDAGSGTVTLGSNSGSVNGHSLKFGSTTFSPLVAPDAATTLDLVLENKDFDGCGVMPGCTTWTHHLALTASGEFAKSKGTVASAGIAGGSFTSLSHYPPDEHGTYEILSDGRIRFTFADGTVEDSTIGFELDGSGRPDPAGEGLLLDDVNFYPPSD